MHWDRHSPWADISQHALGQTPPLADISQHALGQTRPTSRHIPACTGADPPPRRPLQRTVRILLECIPVKGYILALVESWINPVRKLPNWLLNFRIWVRMCADSWNRNHDVEGNFRYNYSYWTKPPLLVSFKSMGIISFLLQNSTHLGMFQFQEIKLMPYFCVRCASLWMFVPVIDLYSDVLSKGRAGIVIA